MVTFSSVSAHYRLRATTHAHIIKVRLPFKEAIMPDTCVPTIDVSAEMGKRYPQRSDLRYRFVAAVELVDPQSGKQIVSATSNLSRYGCHVRTAAPFFPGTPVKIKITHGGGVFQSGGTVAYTIQGEGMGIHFGDVASEVRVLLKEWLQELSAKEFEFRLRETPRPRINLSREEKIVLVSCVLGLAAVIAAAVAWLGGF
jgi:hypothetical protein